MRRNDGGSGGGGGDEDHHFDYNRPFELTLMVIT